jgi:WhiB family redox-sensing transcriptional regulator
VSTYLAHRPGVELRDPLAGIVPALPRGALCAKTNPEDWFHDSAGTYPDVLFDICRACPIVMAYLDWAVDNDERWGIWGGTSPGDREDIRKGKKPKQPRLKRTLLASECEDCGRVIETRIKGRCNRCYIRARRAA